jgi:hypothetical protein
VRRNRFEIFEIPTEQGVVRILLNDGGMQVEDASGETYADGWATVEDIASELSARIHLPPTKRGPWRSRPSAGGRNDWATALIASPARRAETPPLLGLTRVGDRA